MLCMIITCIFILFTNITDWLRYKFKAFGNSRYEERLTSSQIYWFDAILGILYNQTDLNTLNTNTSVEQYRSEGKMPLLITWAESGLKEKIERQEDRNPEIHKDREKITDILDKLPSILYSLWSDFFWSGFCPGLLF